MKTNLLDNVSSEFDCNICISRSSSYICVFNTGIRNIEQFRLLIEKAFEAGKKLNINKYLFDATGIDFKESFIINCEYFYNIIFYIANISVAEKIALFVGRRGNSPFLLTKLTNYYMDNFKIFKSRNSAVEYLVKDAKIKAFKNLKYPCSAIPRYSTLELSVNSNKSACVLCRNTKFRFDPGTSSTHPFKCIQCGAEYAISDFPILKKTISSSV